MEEGGDQGVSWKGGSEWECVSSAACIKHRPRGGGLWMLKNNKQRGTGLRLVEASQAFDACFETTTRPGLEGMILYRWAWPGS